MNYSMLLARPTRRPPPPTITILSQPQDATSSIAPVVSEFSTALPSPVASWNLAGSFADTFFAASGNDGDSDFLATAFWDGPDDESPSLTFSAKTDGVSALAGTNGWSDIQYSSSVLATQAGQQIAVSSNGGNSWTSQTRSGSTGDVFFGGGLLFRSDAQGVHYSADAATWTLASTTALDSGSVSFGHADGGWFFAVDPPSGSASSVGGLYASADGQTFIKIKNRGAGGVGGNIESVVKFGGYWYVATADGALQKTDLLTSAVASGISSLYSYGSQVAVSGQALVAYSRNGTVNYSSDGATWTEATLPAALSSGRRGTLWNAAGRFFLMLGSVAGTESRYLVGSADGASWQQFTRSTSCLTDRLFPRSKSYTVSASGGTRTRAYTFACDTNGSNAFRVLQIAGVRNDVTFSVSASVTGGSLSYSWQRLLNGEWTDMTVLLNQSATGVQTPTMTVREPTTAFNGSQYRCVVTASGAEPVISSPATLTVI
jgi:hypothetical protein